MIKYLEQFELLVAKTTGVVLPDPVLLYSVAHTVLKNAGLSKEALLTVKAAASDMKFKSIKESNPKEGEVTLCTIMKVMRRRETTTPT